MSQNQAQKTAAPPDALQQAIQKSQDHLLNLQFKDGYWMGELMVDTTIVSDMICYYHWDNKVNPQWQQKAVNHLLANQLPDGGWNLYHGGPAEVNATIKAYLALKLAGVPVTDPRMLKAREIALRMGGVPRMNTFSKLYLALLGLFPWDYVPTIPCEVILIGKWFHVNFWEMSSWTRAMLVPLAIINHFKPTRPLNPSVTLDELYPEGLHERDLALPPHPEGHTRRHIIRRRDRLPKIGENNRLPPFRKMSLKKAEDWMLERFEGSDGLAAIFPGILYSIIALKALGYPDDHPEVQRQNNHLYKLHHETEDQVWFEPCLSPVWDTVITLICLRESGVPKDHPRITQAMNWVLDREIRFRGDWKHKNPANVDPSGWAFEFENKWNPDVDDTAMVLLALRLIPTDNPERAKEVFDRAVTWILSFQCKDGGWAAFDKDCTKNILEKVPFADHNAMLDPECADITARILELLGYEDFPTDHPQVAKALQYLRNQQESDGSWYGRWGVNYIYGTWQSLRGLRALKVNMNEPWVLKARDWLESVQHSNGGWGESCNTYEDPVFKGRGPTTASQTAWALMGLLAFGDPNRPSIQRGIQYLVKAQNPDGSWTEDATTGTGFPKVYYLKYDMYRNTWPLLALATYKKLLAGRQAGDALD